MTAKPVVVPAKKVSEPSDLESSLRSIKLYESKKMPLEDKNRAKYIDGTILLALNAGKICMLKLVFLFLHHVADNDKWEEARILSYEEGLYEVADYKEGSE